MNRCLPWKIETSPSKFFSWPYTSCTEPNTGCRYGGFELTLNKKVIIQHMSGITLLSHNKNPCQPHSAPYTQFMVHWELSTAPTESCNFQPSSSWQMSDRPTQLMKPANKEQRGKNKSFCAAALHYISSVWGQICARAHAQAGLRLHSSEQGQGRRDREDGEIAVLLSKMSCPLPAECLDACLNRNQS